MANFISLIKHTHGSVLATKTVKTHVRAVSSQSSTANETNFYHYETLKLTIIISMIMVITAMYILWSVFTQFLGIKTTKILAAPCWCTFKRIYLKFFCLGTPTWWP